MKVEVLGATYDILINLSSGWFGLTLVREFLAIPASRHSPLGMLYNIGVGFIYFYVSVKIKEKINYDR